MKKYSVTLYLHTNIEVEVNANDEEEAIENAYNMIDTDDKDIVEALLFGLQEDDTPDVIQL